MAHRRFAVDFNFFNELIFLIAVRLISLRFSQRIICDNLDVYAIFRPTHSRYSSLNDSLLNKR